MMRNVCVSACVCLCVIEGVHVEREKGKVLCRHPALSLEIKIEVVYR